MDDLVWQGKVKHIGISNFSLKQLLPYCRENGIIPVAAIAAKHNKTVAHIDNRTIRTDKVINGLDRFVIDFLKVIERYTDYVIVSGYVAILFGRSRATEDVDVFVKEMEKQNAEDADEVYAYLNDGLAVRFAVEGETIPNFEVKFAGKRLG